MCVAVVARRRQAENHARKLTSEVRDKGRELSALEGLVMRYQTELNNLAMAAANVEADGEALVARVGQRGMVEVWENQRFYHVIGWSSNLLGTDRCASAVVHACVVCQPLCAGIFP